MDWGLVVGIVGVGVAAGLGIWQVVVHIRGRGDDLAVTAHRGPIYPLALVVSNQGKTAVPLGRITITPRGGEAIVVVPRGQEAVADDAPFAILAAREELPENVPLRDNAIIEFEENELRRTELDPSQPLTVAVKNGVGDTFRYEGRPKDALETRGRA